MILIDSNSRIENYEFKTDFFLIKIIILRLNVKKETIKKSSIFVEQYVKVRLETAYKNRNKYVIISRVDSKESRR